MAHNIMKWDNAMTDAIHPPTAFARLFRAWPLGWRRKPAPTEDPYANLGTLPPYLLRDVGFDTCPQESSPDATVWRRENVRVIHHTDLPDADAILFGR
ncbi:MAG: hypothetical protein CMH12_18150 [Maritimibacter sp.]|nr:hypothetical protein [Maritimibacter sp.]